MKLFVHDIAQLAIILGSMSRLVVLLINILTLFINKANQIKRICNIGHTGLLKNKFQRQSIIVPTLHVDRFRMEH